MLAAEPKASAQLTETDVRDAVVELGAAERLDHRAALLDRGREVVGVEVAVGRRRSAMLTVSVRGLGVQARRRCSCRTPGRASWRRRSTSNSSDGERFIASSTVEKPSKALPAPGLRLQSFSVGSGPSLIRSLIAEDSTALPAPLIEASTFMSQFTDQWVPLRTQTVSPFLIAMPGLEDVLALEGGQAARATVRDGQRELGLIPGRAEPGHARRRALEVRVLDVARRCQ